MKAFEAWQPLPATGTYNGAIWWHMPCMGNEFEPATELFQPPGGGKMGSCGNGEEVRPGLVV